MNRMNAPFQTQNTPPLEAGRNSLRNIDKTERWLAIGRGLWWLVTLVVVALNVASLPVAYSILQTECSQPTCIYQLTADQIQQLQNFGLSLPSFAFLVTSIIALVTAIYVIVAFILFQRQSAGWIGLLGAYTLVVFGTMTALDNAILIGLAYPSLKIPVSFLDYLGHIFFTLFIIVFPDGRLNPRWSIWLVAAWAIFIVPSIFFPRSFLDANNWFGWILILILAALIVSLIGVQYYRYHRYYGPVLRQQTKWVVFGLMVSLGGFVVLLFIGTLLPPPFRDNAIVNIFFQIIEYLLMLMIPLSFAISILRYKLWEIDLLINRTLVYVPLTAILGGLFSASVTMFQKIFVATTGQKSDAAIVMTTFVLVATFTPIRNRLQTAVDKRFKESKDPIKELKVLDDQVQAVVEVLDAHLITRRLLDTAVTAFQASGGAVYLEQAGQMVQTHATPGWREEDQALSFPLEWQGRQLGKMCLGAREAGVEYSEQERQLLQQAANRIAWIIAGFGDISRSVDI
jgi:hypothetical protein